MIQEMGVRKSGEMRGLLSSADAVCRQDRVKEDGVLADVCLPGIGGPTPNRLDVRRSCTTHRECRRTSRPHGVAANVVRGDDFVEATRKPAARRDRAVAPQPKLEMAWEKTVARGDVLQEGCEGIRATTYGILHDNVGVFENLSDLWGCKTNLA